MNRYSKYSKSPKGKMRSKRYKDKNKEKIKARNKARYVHRISQVCSIKECNETAERHHSDYKKMEDIIWLCRKHHKEIHGVVRGRCWCGKDAHAKKLCKNHYAKKFRKEQGW